MYDASVLLDSHGSTPAVRTLSQQNGVSVQSTRHGESKRNSANIKSDIETPSRIGSVVDYDSYVDAKMIDFTHVFPSETLDTNYIKGLEGIIQFFNRVLE